MVKVTFNQWVTGSGSSTGRLYAGVARNWRSADLALNGVGVQVPSPALEKLAGLSSVGRASDLYQWVAFSRLPA